MRNLLLLMGFAALIASSVSADQARQTCETIATTEAPESLRGAIQQLKPAAIRVCKQIDYNTETYSALGPIAPLSNGVCHYFETVIGPQRARVRTEFMVRASARCPSQTSGDYVAVDFVSVSDFVAITDLLGQITASPEAFTKAFSALQSDRLGSREFKSFEQYVNQKHHIKVLRISRMSNFIGLFSMFDVLIEKPGDASARYALRVRKLFGWLSIVDIDYDIS